jgi:hypothetical protein
MLPILREQTVANGYFSCLKHLQKASVSCREELCVPTACSHKDLDSWQRGRFGGF